MKNLKHIALLIFFTINLSLFAQKTVKILPVKGNPMVITNFNQDGKDYWIANFNGAIIHLNMKDVKKVVFLEPGNSSSPVEVTFNDGRKDNFKLIPSGRLYGDSKYGTWHMSHTQIKEIDFNPASPPVNSDGNTQSENDKIILKNGDQLSGTIHTSSYNLETSYGMLAFDRKDIAMINFEGEGSKIDVVILKNGDKMSGVIENEKISITLINGSLIQLSKDKIKTINFK